MKSVTIKSGDVGQRLDRFLAKNFPKITKGVLRREIRNNNVKINGKRPSVDYRLCEADILKLYLDGALLESGQIRENQAFTNAKPVNIIYSDENIIIADKPAGLLSQADSSGEADNLENRLRGNFNSGEIHLCHRLDRNTRGLIIAGRNPQAVRVMSEKIKCRQVKKLYAAEVWGFFDKPADTLTAYHRKFADRNLVEIFDKPSPARLEIKTAYRVLSTTSDTSVIEIDLLTGRTHQIRAHMAYIGHPLLGDGKYGSREKYLSGKKKGATFQRLSAICLTFDFHGDSGILEYLNGRSFRLPFDGYFTE